ncbi:MAG: helix-turn-helix transcriptional regulator [Geminicoccaceae bacterium]
MSDLSPWLEELRAACAATSQTEVARRLGYSASTISMVLKGTYNGDLKRFSQAVEGLLLSAEVECPVLETIPRHRCVAEQKRQEALKSPLSTNATRVQLWRWCRGPCPHSRIRKGASDAQP